MDFLIGSTLSCSRTVRGSSGAYVDPATSMQIEVTQLAPLATVISYTDMIRDSLGHYHYDVQTLSFIPGIYRVRYRAIDGLQVTIKDDYFTLEI